MHVALDLNTKAQIVTQQVIKHMKKVKLGNT